MAWKSGEEMKLLDGMLKQRSGLNERIQVFDYAPRPFLLSLIRSAKAVVFPSLYEGFGLPVLEAMQLGVPTLCSTEGSLPEVAGHASINVDPYDVAAIARGLRILDQDYEVRRQLALAGAERAKMFDSSSYKARLLGMYDRVL
ncbi:D-inositol 3-phosphate glycosyltransferase [Paraburkholderia aspalathi]|uniref:glycosyltransferase n=1 Tax=Paraburkholderia aspalathi TaxID=1324617 RepID=UPI0019096D45|nr:glycosyltransferase [Paraburkholderia aspalathi]MBK3844236.1 glycosyltransferase family 4 protein [Paraburkholderia aspalathi]CAE6869667.1 D-inositol 3-phosphate glycosyltransferase [Paraburkholderia aspalathi]